MKKFFSSLIGLAVGLTLALLLTFFAGENPLSILTILFKSAFGSTYDFGLTLFYTTPLIFCGLAVAVAFHAGLFNIGGEGQLTVAAVTAAWVGVQFKNTPHIIAPLFALFAAVLAAALWAGIAGWLKTRRGSHEVIVTIMLNFIASGLASFITLSLIPNPESQNPETAKVAPQFMTTAWDPIQKFFVDTPANFSLIVALICSVLMWIFLWKTPAGFKLRAVGTNFEAAQRQNIDPKKWQLIAMLIAGSMAGLVALSEVLGSAGQYRIGFSPDYGFIGIAVSLAAFNNPLGIILTAFLMGALHKGASDLDMETANITRDFSKVIQAFVILGVSSAGILDYIKNRGKK
ncbi:MAG: ABC transporter permease [Bdellovibrionia bacterium]